MGVTRPHFLESHAARVKLAVFYCRRRSATPPASKPDDQKPMDTARARATRKTALPTLAADTCKCYRPPRDGQLSRNP